MGEWREVRIGDFLHRVKQLVRLQDDENYKLVTVRMHHNGVVLRELKKGKLIGSNMYRVKSGQFILSGIDARHGAFGVVPEELDDAIVTNDFWYFDVDENVVSRDFFLWLTTTPLFLDACIKSSEGTTNRRRLQGDKFFNFSFHFPKIDEQKRLAERFNAVDTTFAAIKDTFEQQSEYLKQLRQAVLQEAVEGKLTAAWRKLHPVVKGDPQYDAAALLTQIKAEKERLVKEGKIRKEKPLPPIADDDKPFDLPDGWVWCRLGEVADFNTGKLDSNAAVEGGQYPFFTCSKTPLEIDKYSFDCEAVLLAGNNAAGNYNVKYYHGKFDAYQRTYVITANQYYDGFVDYRYMKLLLEYCLDELKEKSLGSLTQYLTLGILKPLIVILPPHTEQQAIVARVDSLMAIIDELEKQVAERKEQAQLLMQTVLREAFDESCN